MTGQTPRPGQDQTPETTPQPVPETKPESVPAPYPDMAPEGGPGPAVHPDTPSAPVLGGPHDAAHARLRAPLFLERQSYRRRRLMDAARILPVAGLVALLVPVLWSRDGQASTASEAVYIFGLWLVLILTAVALSRPLHAAIEREGTSPPVPPAPSLPGAVPTSAKVPPPSTPPVA